MAETNPNGANQYVLDPRQSLFFEYYLDPKSETFSNALQSAVMAGYTEEYAKVLMSKMPTWLSEKVNDMNLLSKAERNINKFLDMDEHPMIQADITKFVAKGLGKTKYSERHENINIELPVPLLENLKK